MNKYIGETEKNLSAALDEAESLDVALLLDEADALFGRRGDGDGEGERYANMVTNFLLTRLERHRGITVLTTNARNRMDPAFTRRFDFVFDFPLPGPEERLAIWKAHLGERAPDEESCRILAAECELPGGFVRTAALNAAAAVPGGGPIPLPALAEAAVEEYRKLGRTVPAMLARIAAHG
jgi:SpoVK/Ycf46/Vps4 family AAA+-type ATPase